MAGEIYEVQGRLDFEWEKQKDANRASNTPKSVADVIRASQGLSRDVQRSMFSTFETSRINRKDLLEVRSDGVPLDFALP